MILVSILAMLQIHLLMTLLVLLLTPLSMVISRFIAMRSYHLFQKQTETRGIQTQLIEESLTQQTFIQSFNAQEEFVERLHVANDNYAGYSQSAIFYSSTVNPSTRFVNSLIYALLAGVGALRIMAGSTLTIGRLVTFLNYVQQYTKPFNDISSVLAELQSALACAERVYTVLKSPEVTETGLKELNSDQVKGAISFKHVSFGYTLEKILIKDLSIDIPAGSKVAIVGPTGAGKSTIINLLMRFYPINSGDILLDDSSIYDYTRASLRQQFGMVLQETWLKQGTIHDNIAVGNPDASREQVIAAVKASKMRCYFSPTLFSSDVETTAETIARTRAVIETIKGYQDPNFKVMVAPHSPYSCSRDLLEASLELAKEENIPLHIHVAETQEESGIILKRYGKRPIDFLDELGYLDHQAVFAHGVEINEAEIARLADSQVAIAHNPISNLKLASGIAPVVQLQKAGVPVGIATDSVASNNNLDMFEEGRTAALLQKMKSGDASQFPIETALKALTIEGAKVLGMDDEIGSLEVGKQADFLVIQPQGKIHLQPQENMLSHLVYAVKSSDVDDVYIAGEQVVRAGKVLTVDL